LRSRRPSAFLTEDLLIELRKGAKSVVSRDQLQVYLDEFVFRHNRRRLRMAAFQTLLVLGAGRKATPYKQIRGAAGLSMCLTVAEPQVIACC
jgi:hypothetical protein